MAMMRDRDTSHLWARWLYLRILGLLYAAEFLSLSWEIVGILSILCVYCKKKDRG